MLASDVRTRRSRAIARRFEVAVAACLVLAMVAAPLCAFAYIDEHGGGPTGGEFLAYTPGPSLHPDRVDEIAARAALAPRISPDRADELAGRSAYLAYHEGPTLHPDRLDEIAARQNALPRLHPDRIDEMNARR